MPNERQKINKSLYEELTRLNKERIVLAAEQIDVRASEAVMQEEARALPKFFKHGDGIYNRLLVAHPRFASHATTKQAEDETIKEIIEEIKKRLATAKDRLNHDQVVGPVAAQQAVTDPSKRYRREYRNSHYSAWDDIGRYHSALRLLLDDATLHPSSVWKTHYFNGISSYKEKTYRHYLALIWKGATEDNIEAPINFSGIPSAQLKEGAIDQFITVLAQCRREHNFDGTHSDWDQSKKPQDSQRCDIGLRGDLFGQMLIHNEHYMQTRTNLNIELIEPLIKDIIFDEFKKLDTDAKIKIIHYLENKAIVLVDPEEEETEALNTFIRNTKLVALEKLLQNISSATVGTPLYKIHSFLTTIQQKAERGERDAITGLSKIMDELDKWIKLEAESLQLIERTNAASMDYIRRIANDGIAQVFQKRLKEALDGSASAREQLIVDQDTLSNKINALQYHLDGSAIRASAFVEAPCSVAKKAEYQQLIQHYETKTTTLETQIRLMIESYATQPRDTVGKEFSLLGDTGIAGAIDRQKQQFVRQQEQVLTDLEQKKAQLAHLKLLINNEQVNGDDVRPYLKTMIDAYPEDKKRSPDFYAAYLWNLLLEKTPAEHYIIEGFKNNELSQTLDLIFGNETKRIKGLDNIQQCLIMYAFNAKRKQLIADGRSEISVVNRWKLIEDYLATKKITLGATENVPNPHLITFYETAYQASKLPSKTWRTIIERSDKQSELENTMGISDETREIARQDLRYPEQMMGAAIHLSLSLYGEIDAEKQKVAVAIWKNIARSIFTHYPQAGNQHVEALTNFVTQTLMVQLGIKQFVKEDQIVLRQIVKQYMGVHNYENFPLPFTPEPKTIENRITCLAQHLELMITTLSPPAIKTSFEQGIIRLMSRDKAQETVKNNKYVIRMSNNEPNKLVVTIGTGVAGNKYITSAAKQSVSVGTKTYEVSLFPDNALKTAVDPHITHRKAIVPSVTLEQMTSVVFQKQQAQSSSSAYEAVTYYQPVGIQQGFFREKRHNPGLREAIEKVDKEIEQNRLQ